MSAPEQHDALREAFRRRAEREQTEVAVAPMGLPEVDPPDSWPHSFVTYQEARGMVLRIRAGGSREGKAIAEEYGVSRRTISRVVANVCQHVGDYDPDSWRAYERERKALGRRRFLDYCVNRDRQQVERRAEIETSRDALLEQRFLLERMELEAELAEPHVAEPVTHSTRHRLTRGERQRRLNAKTRRYAGA